jgi:hypothetical protein
MKWKEALLAVSLATGIASATTLAPVAETTASAKALSKKDIATYKNGSVPGAKFKVGATYKQLKAKKLQANYGIVYDNVISYEFLKGTLKNSDKVKVVTKENVSVKAKDLQNAFGKPIVAKNVDYYEVPDVPQKVFKAGKYYILYGMTYEMEAGPAQHIHVGSKASIEKKAKEFYNWKLKIK